MGDLILGILLLVAVWDGYRRGIIKLLGSFGGLLVGVFAARRLTPVLLPMLGQKLNMSLYGGGANDSSQLVAEWFFTNTALGRLVELVLFVVLTAAITWLVHWLVGAVGSLINSTPLVGFVCRVLGACAEVFVLAMVLYFIYTWFLPWLIGIIPEAVAINSIFSSSQYLLPIIKDIGSLVWYSAWQALTTPTA